jgi:hypothetical protein
MRMEMVYEEEEEGGREGWRCQEDGGWRMVVQDGGMKRGQGGTRKNHMKRMEVAYEDEDGDGVRGGGWMEV